MRDAAAAEAATRAREAALRAPAIEAAPTLEDYDPPGVEESVGAMLARTGGLDTATSGAVRVPRLPPEAYERRRLGKQLESKTLTSGDLRRVEGRIRALAAGVRPVYLGAREPRTVSEAIAGANAKSWSAAMDAEMHQMGLEGFGVWVLIPRSPRHNVLKSKWVFKIKRDALGYITKLKARLTLKGYNQVKGRDFDDTWAPTGRLRSLRYMLAEASAHPDVGTAQWDCTSAFLHAAMDFEVVMEQPEGYVEEGREDHVCLLLKALYGTKQASKLFHDLVRSTLLGLGGAVGGAACEQSDADCCLFIVRRGASWVKILTHVDDFAVTFNDKAMYTEVFGAMQAVFKITADSPISHFLGVRVTRRGDGAYLLDQQAYIDELLERLGMEGCALFDSPEATGSKARLHPLEAPNSPADAEFMAEVPYRAAVGALWWVARCTRYDIFRAVQQLARFVSDPGPEHWAAARRTLGYLRKTKAKPLVLKASGGEAHLEAGVDTSVVGYSDADWAGCAKTSRSHTGWLVFYRGALVAWRAEMQSCVAQSSCEAEYIAANSLCNELAWWRRLRRSVGHKAVGPYAIKCDNKAAETLAKHPGHFEATKHIRMRFHHLRDQQARRKTLVQWCPARRQWADVLTKNCAVKHFRRMVARTLQASIHDSF
jgi:hypothetical protein